jgi:hypothetical protein
MPAKKKGAMKQALSAEEMEQLRTGSPGPALDAPTEIPTQSIEAPQAAPQEPTLSPEEQALMMQAKEAQTKLSSIGALDVGPQGQANMPPPDKTYLEVNGMPSSGSFYKAQVYGQPLKVQDLLLIQSVDEKNVTSRFDQIFNRRLWGIKPGEILTIDEMFFALWLRATSFEGYDFPSMPFQCTSCNYETKPDEASFNWGDVAWDVNNIEDTLKLHESGAYEVVLPQSQVPVKIYLRRRKHMTMVNELVKRDFWNYGKEPSDEYYELLVMCAVLDLGVNDLKQTAAYIQELPAVDFVTLIKEINNASVDAEPVINVKCPRCQEENPVTGYPFRPDIYLPTDS